MDRQDTQSPDWSSMSDEGLAAQTHIYASRVDAGYDDGSREYHLAAVIERCIRDLAAMRDLASKWSAA